MPGKVNPVISEAVNQVAYIAIGHDLTVTMCAEGGQLQLNALEPTIGYCILSSMRMMTAAGSVCEPHHKVQPIDVYDSNSLIGIGNSLLC